MTAAVLRGGIGHPQRSFIHNSSLQPVSKSSSARVSQLSFVRSKHRPRSARHQAFVSNSAQHAVSTATAAVAGLGSVGTQVTSSLQSCLDSAVLLATVGASFKLFLICAAVGWLLRNKKIPNSTATVLSQVSFQLVIPAMLFSKVAFTLAAQPSGSLLLVTVVVTLAQICLGAFFGRALAPLVDGQYSRDRTILGWHPLNPARSASAIAASVGTATGVPLAASALLPRAKAPPEGIRELVALACAFGNSFTLPAVFFATLLPGPVADRAMGYAAVFMLAWSPALWSIGYSMIAGGGGEAPQHPAQMQRSERRAAGGGAARPGGGRLGQAPGLLPGAVQRGEEGRADVAPGGLRGGLRRVTSGAGWEVVEGVGSADEGVAFSPSSGFPAEDAAQEGGTPGAEPPPNPHHLAVFDRVMRFRLLRALRQFAALVLNPPVLGILLGMAAGLTPWGRAMLGSMRSAAGAGAMAGLPLELGLVHGVVRAVLEVVELLAAGALALQTLVLASSLLAQGGGGAMKGAGTGSGVSGSPGGVSSWVRALKQEVLPGDAMEGRALAVLSLVRFLLVPLGTLGVLWALRRAGALAAVDPVLIFVLLVEAVMPSAQNLIILLQLSERTQSAAPGFARLLLKLYAYAVLPVTLWVTAFATRLAIPVLR